MANDIERPYPLIRGELEAGRVVPFLGSGASRLQGSGDGLPVLPSAGELSLLLAKATSSRATTRAIVAISPRSYEASDFNKRPWEREFDLEHR